MATVVLAASLALVPVAAAGAQEFVAPANDDWQDASPLTAGSLSGTSAGATSQDEVAQDGATVWFRRTAPVDERLEVVVQSSGTTVLYLYDESPESGADPAESAAATEGGSASLTHRSPADATYWLAVWAVDEGPFTGSVSVDPLADGTVVFDGSGPVGVDLSDRSGAVHLWAERWRPAAGTPEGATTNVDTCSAGDSSAASKAAVLSKIRYYRELSGLPGPVRLDDALNAKAQQAALIMAAQNSLSHFPPSSWRCWNEVGADAAARSNLYLGRSGDDAIDGYIADLRVESLGHRWWILAPDSTTFGTGDTGSSNALWVFPSSFDGPGWRADTREPFVAWPPPGYVPDEGSIRAPRVAGAGELFTGGFNDGLDWSIRLPDQADSVRVAATHRGRTVFDGAAADTGYERAWRFRPALSDADIVGDSTVEVMVTATEGGLDTVYRYRTTFMDPNGVARFAGANRYETAAAFVLEEHLDDPPDVVYVATGESFADGLAAGGPGAPVLLTDRDALSPATYHALVVLDPARIVLVGGTGAVSSTVEAELAQLAPVTRLAGGDRFDTAAQVARHAWSSRAPIVYVATGLRFPDALAAGAADAPILLSAGSTLHPETRAALTDLRPGEIVVLGGPAAIPAAVFEELASLAPTTRIAGVNRYETAAQLAARLGTGGGRALVTSGVKFADALAAGGAGIPILLTAPGDLPTSTRTALASLRPRSIGVVGGMAAVSGTVASQLLSEER